MAEYHILKKSVDSRYAEVYVHLPIPATQTTAGAALGDATLTYRRALKESLEQESKDAGGDGTITSKVPGTDVVVPPATTSELEDMQAGELKEYYIHFRFSSPDLTDSQRRSEIENGNDNMKGVSLILSEIATPGSDIWNEVLEPLEWFGYYRDVP